MMMTMHPLMPTPVDLEMVEELKEILKKFEPYALLQKIVVIGSLPGNEIYCVRLETLFKLIISIPEKEFKKNDFLDSDLETILKKLDDITDWSLGENYDATKSTDYPPMWILGNRYRVFSGVLERSYEYWKFLVRYYFPLNNNFIKQTGYDPILIIQEFLDVQTRLFSLFDSNIEFKSIRNMKIPSQDFITQWESCIKNWEETSSIKTFLNSKQNELGFQLMGPLIESDPEDSIYQFSQIKIGDKHQLIFPHCFYGFITSTFSTDIQNFKDQCTKTVLEEIQFNIYEKLLKLFNRKEILFSFSVGGNEKTDISCYFDSSKLFLIKIINLDFIDDIQSHINESLKEFEELCKKIKAGNKTIYKNDQEVEKLPDVKIELIPIVLFHTIKTNLMFTLPKSDFVDKDIFWNGMSMDFLSLLEDVKTAMHFLKYLRRENMFKQKIEMHAMHSLDFYAHYMKNKESFLLGGKLPNFVYFDPGYWYKYKLEQIKNHPDFQAKYDDGEYDDFWELEEIDKNVFSVINRLNEYVAGIFKLNDGRVIWICAMAGPNDYIPMELHSFKLLTDLIPYRITKSNDFMEFLEKLHVTPKDDISITLMPSTRIERLSMTQFQDPVQKLSESNPAVVVSKVAPSGKIIFYVVYSTDFLENLFKSDVLQAEKNILNVIFMAISKHFSNIIDESLVKNCLERLFKDAKPGFSLSSMSSPHPVTSVIAPQFPKTMETDRSESTRMIAEFFSNQNIEPGTYENKKAKEILDKTFKFLKESIIDRLKYFNYSDLFPFILHTMGELVQSREINKHQTRNDLELITEFDPMQRFLDANEEIKTLSVTLRYLLDLSVAIFPESDNPFTEEKWLEVQALGEEIVKTSIFSDNLHYGLASYRLVVCDDFSFNLENITQGNLQEHNIRFEQLLITERTKSVNLKDEESTKKFYNEINDSFKDEFDVNFKNFENTLFRCLEFLHEKDVPTQIVNQNEILSYVKIKLNNLSDQEILSALDLASISSEKLDTGIVPTWTRTRKHRSAIQPFVFFEDNSTKKYVLNAWILDNCIGRWIKELDQGFLPFNDNLLKPDGLLIKKLEEIKLRANNAHEKQVTELISTKTNYHESNIEKNQRCFQNLSESAPGEIDDLAIFPDQKIIIVSDSKNIQMNYSPREISNELKSFVEPEKGYIKKILGKKEFVERNTAEILNYYSIPMEGDWEVRAIFVTSSLSLMAEDPEKFQIISLFDLEKFLVNLLN